MPKTIAITPSWYWPADIPRVVGVPPYSIFELCIRRHARNQPDAVALIDAAGSLRFGELAEEVTRLAAPIALEAGESRLVTVPGELSRASLLHLLAALAGGVRVQFAGRTTALPASNSTAPPSPLPGELLDPRLPAVLVPGGRAGVWHSNRSLLAMAISMATYLDAGRERPWISTLPLSTWEGLMALLTPLHLGAPLVIPPPGADPDSLLGLISRHNAGFIVAELEAFATVCREAKRAAKDARKVLEAALLAVDGPFDPDQRRRVSKSLECPALTFWGMPETGPVFASHQSWYMDESVGLPMTNAHVVPADPRTGEPIQALWELVELAEVTVFSPSLMSGYEEGAAPPVFAGSRFRTGMLASSDANGMVYLLGS
ncbi:MAG: hypothetical protein C0506_06495 [Anaerolinea sp.]|nr:hypothetical protein [Anaerolinea sp.]